VPLTPLTPLGPVIVKMWLFDGGFGGMS
jgi:hypothetical protein